MPSASGFTKEYGRSRVHQPLLRTERKLLVTLTDQQLRQLISFKPRTFNQWRIHALVSVILDTGCRVDEVIQLRTGNVDLENLLITVYGKGNKERKVPFSYELRKILFRYGQFRAKHEIDFDLVFPSRRGTKWGQRPWQPNT